MHLLLVGISHKTAPVELRERIDFHTRGLRYGAARAGAAAGERRDGRPLDVQPGRAVCGKRTGARPSGTSSSGSSREFHGVERAALTPHVYELLDLDAARHLFRVAAGLDSLVVGEPQILGQVKEAYTAAADVQAVGPVLNRLFHSSFGVGKRVRTETGLGSGAVSVSFAAVSLARKIFGDLKGRSVVVVGAGEMGKLTALHMKSQGVNHVTIVSRTMAHAARTAEAIGGALAAPWDDLDAALGASRHRHHAPPARPRRFSPRRASRRSCGRGATAPLFIIDIALPRDVEPAAGEIEQVFLYNIDDLQATVAENLARRSSEVDRAEAIVAEEVEKFERLAAIARRNPDGCRAAPALRDHPPRRARSAGFQAVRAAARGSCPRRRSDPPHRRKAAATRRPSS